MISRRALISPAPLQVVGFSATQPQSAGHTPLHSSREAKHCPGPASSLLALQLKKQHRALAYCDSSCDSLAECGSWTDEEDELQWSEDAEDADRAAQSRRRIAVPPPRCVAAGCARALARMRQRHGLVQKTGQTLGRWQRPGFRPVRARLLCTP